MVSGRQVERDRKLGGVFGIITGILLVVMFSVPGNATTGSAQAQLNSFDNNRALLTYVLNALVAIFGSLFIVFLRTALWSKNPTLVTAAAFFPLAAILLLTASTFYTTSAMSVLSGIYKSTTSSAADRAAAVVSAQVLQSFGVGTLGLIVALPAGIVLFSIAIQRSGVIPNWVGDVGFASAIVLWVGVGLGAYGALSSGVNFAFFLVYLILFLVWIFGSSAFMWRSARKIAVAEPAPM